MGAAASQQLSWMGALMTELQRVCYVVMAGRYLSRCCWLCQGLQGVVKVGNAWGRFRGRNACMSPTPVCDEVIRFPSTRLTCALVAKQVR